MSVKSLVGHRMGGTGSPGGAKLGSVLPLRDAALHLQHVGPPLELVGFCVVLYMLRKERGGANKGNQ